MERTLTNISRMLCFSFNQNCTCFCIGTEHGFVIYKSYPLNDYYRRELNGGIGHIAMFNNSNIIGLVGGGKRPFSSLNKLVIWNDANSKVVLEITVDFKIIDIKVKDSLIAIVGKKKIKIYYYDSLEDIMNYKEIDDITTPENGNAIFSMNLNPNKNIIAYLTKNMGEIMVKTYPKIDYENLDNSINQKNYTTKKISAHQTEITLMALNHQGDIIASCSQKGSIIRLFSTYTGYLLKELRRGTDFAEIYSLNFDPTSQYILCSSSKGTVHVFNVVKNKAVKNPKSILSSVGSFLNLQNTYLDNEWSFAQYHIDCKINNIQETYWRGILGHDGKPNRVYREFQKGAKELEKIGDRLVNMKKRNRVALLFSHDSKHALDFMPYTDNDQYKVNLMYDALYRQNIECDILSVDKPQMQDFSQYDLLVVPSLYVATDELLRKISDFVREGGEVVMLYKSGYTDYDNAVRPVLAPGPLTEACGFTYQEYSSINKLPLKPNGIGAADNTVNTWMEFLQLTTAQPLATVDHQFFGQWPCITENQYGKGHLIYIGTIPSADLLYKLIARAADRKGIATVERQYQFPIVLRSGTNSKGRQIHYLFNYTYEPKTVTWPYPASQSLLDQQTLVKGQDITIEPWGVVIGEEK